MLSARSLTCVVLPQMIYLATLSCLLFAFNVFLWVTHPGNPADLKCFLIQLNIKAAVLRRKSNSTPFPLTEAFVGQARPSLSVYLNYSAISHSLWVPIGGGDWIDVGRAFSQLAENRQNVTELLYCSDYWLLSLWNGTYSKGISQLILIHLMSTNMSWWKAINTFTFHLCLVIVKEFCLAEA